MEQQEKRIRFLVNTAYFAVVVAIVYICLRYALGLVLPFVIAFVIASIVRPFVVKVNNKFKMRQEILSFIITILLYVVAIILLLGIIIGIYFLIRELINVIPDFYESSMKPTMLNLLNISIRFFDDLPGSWNSVTNVLNNLLQVINGTKLTDTDSIDSLMKTLSGSIPSILSFSQKSITAITDNVPNFFIALVFTVMLSFFIGMQYDAVLAFFRRILPKTWISVFHDFKSIIGDSIFRYMKAVFKLMAITGIEMFIGLLILQVKYAFLIAVGIAIFDALPIFGTGAIVIPWIIIELFQGNYKLAIGLTIVYIVVSAVRSFIEPKVVGDKLGLNPIISLLSTYVGFKAFGVLGMIFMPILAQIAMQLFQKRKLIEKDVDSTTPLALPAKTTTTEVAEKTKE